MSKMERFKVILEDFLVVIILYMIFKEVFFDVWNVINDLREEVYEIQGYVMDF